MSQALRLLIGGDVCPIGVNEQAFVEGDRATLLGPFAERFADADFRLVNLECPLVREEAPLQKTGPVIGARPETLAGLRAIGMDLAVLANNHLMDHGPGGLDCTLEELAGAGIRHTGAGSDLQQAREPALLDIGGLRIGVLAVAASEFSLAGRNSPGACPIEPLELPDRARALCDKVDQAIAFVHAGPNNYPYPTPRLRELCHKLARCGVALVVCQHSHVAGCLEEVETAAGVSRILYGQGNLLFDIGRRQLSEWNHGVLLEWRLPKEGGRGEIELLPYRQSWQGPGLQRMPADEGASWQQAFERRGREILSEDRVRQLFRRHCEAKRRSLLMQLLSENRLLHRLNARLPLFTRWFTPKRQMLYGNLVRCEDHREMLEELFLGSSD